MIAQHLKESDPTAAPLVFLLAVDQHPRLVVIEMWPAFSGDLLKKHYLQARQHGFPPEC